MSWSSRRQFRIVAIFSAVFALPIVLALFYFLWERPSCEDGVRNGGESGVDCGGSCQVVCTGEANPIVLSWVRPFPVSPGWYNVVAVVENPNTLARAAGLRYRFRIYDEDGVTVAERLGVADVEPQSVFPIVELGLGTGARRAARASFEWLDEPRWVKASPAPRLVAVADERIETQVGEPRIRATIQNVGALPVGKVAVVAIAYDVDGNALAASRTLVDSLPAGASKSVVFTWPAPWPGEATSLEVTPLYDAPVLR